MNDRYKTIFKQTWFLAVVVSSVTMIYILFFVPFHWNVEKPLKDWVYGPCRFESITLLKGWVIKSIYWTAIFCFITLIVTAVISKRKVVKAISSILIFVFLVFFLFVSLFKMGVTWKICDRIAGPDNRSYCYMAWSVMMGGDLALCRSQGETLLVERFEPLASQPKDAISSRWMVRPIGFKQGPYYKLYTTKSGYIVNMSKNECDLAYNVNTGNAYGLETMGELSPFVLIEPNDQLNQGDVQQVLTERNILHLNMYIVEEALENPNEGVREVAKRMLEILDGFAERERLLEDLDSSKYTLPQEPVFDKKYE